MPSLEPKGGPSSGAPWPLPCGLSVSVSPGCDPPGIESPGDESPGGDSPEAESSGELYGGAPSEGLLGFEPLPDDPSDGVLSDVPSAGSEVPAEPSEGVSSGEELSEGFPPGLFPAGGAPEGTGSTRFEGRTVTKTVVVSCKAHEDPGCQFPGTDTGPLAEPGFCQSPELPGARGESLPPGRWPDVSGDGGIPLGLGQPSVSLGAWGSLLPFGFCQSPELPDGRGTPLPPGFC